MSNFLSMDSIDEFEDEMQGDRFPEDLDKAYDRVVQRVLVKSKPSRQNTVKRMLGWIICSKRPLRWREIQSRFSIDAEKGTCNAKRRRLDTCKNIGSSLVDITLCDLFGHLESEQLVHMVHKTAAKYLVQRNIIDLSREHADMALFCCRYLSSRPFLQDSDSECLRDALGSGYFGFLDYTAVHYSHHAEEAQKHTPDWREAVDAAAVGLLKAYPDDDSDLDVRACVQTAPDTLCAETLVGRIRDRLSEIRSAMELQHPALSGMDGYSMLSGPLRFKCSRLDCFKFATGFLDKVARGKHSDKHLRPYMCTYPECFARDLGWESQERLEAHCRAIHKDASSLAMVFPSTKDTKAKDIFEACRKGNLEEIKRFHLAGAQLNDGERKNHVKRDHITPLYLATRARHAHVCKYLISQGVNPFQGSFYMGQLRSPMLEAVRQSSAPIMELFLQTDLDVKDETNRLQYPLFIAMAIRTHHLEGLQILLATPNCLERVTMIMEVVRELTRRMPRTSWSHETEPPADSTLVHTWFRRAFPSIYRERISTSGGTFLIKRPYSADYHTWKEALLHSGVRLLHHALEEVIHPLAMFLLDFADKNDLHVTDNKGRLPIHMLSAAGCVNPDCERALVLMQRIIQMDNGESVNTPDRDGYLPIHHAAGVFYMLTRVIQALIPHTDNLNHRDIEGRSPIFHAVAHPGAIKMLLETNRVDLSIRNNKGQTAFSYAADKLVTVEKPLETLFEANPALAWTADDNEGRQTPLHHIMRTNTEYAKERTAKAKFLLSIPQVENVLRSFLACTTDGNAEACEEVREFARKENLTEALEVMGRIGF